MADDNFDNLLEKDEEQLVPVSRVNTLSAKVKQTAEERDALAKAKEEIEKAKSEAEKERDFYKSFNQVSTKYQGASDYQDKILEKVRSGYDVEDATISILAKEGKYAPQAPQQEREIIAGGSATNQITSGTKELNEMTREEKRQALMEADQKGEVESILRKGIM